MSLVPLNTPTTPRSREAFEILSYNQGLVQFADSKAANLILINSLFIASGQAVEAPEGWMQGLRALFVALSAVAVLCCMAVGTARSDPTTPGSRKDLVFFEDILSRPHASHYASEFFCTPPAVHTEDLVRRIYLVAGFARAKFRLFGVAQALTGWAGALWLLYNLFTLGRTAA